MPNKISNKIYNISNKIPIEQYAENHYPQHVGFPSRICTPALKLMPVPTLKSKGHDL